jgi:hypothetical protein
VRGVWIGFLVTGVGVTGLVLLASALILPGSHLPWVAAACVCLWATAILDRLRPSILFLRRFTEGPGDEILIRRAIATASFQGRFTWLLNTKQPLPDVASMLSPAAFVALTPISISGLVWLLYTEGWGGRTYGFR